MIFASTLLIIGGIGIAYLQPVTKGICRTLLFALKERVVWGKKEAYGGEIREHGSRPERSEGTQ